MHLLTLVLLASPVIQVVDDGTIDWTHREVRVLGVGTPVLLSHTGGATPRDLADLARDDARIRLARVLEGLPVDHRPAREVEALESVFGSALRALHTEPALRFSDGTVHLPVRTSFAWSVALVGPPVPPPRDAPTGLVIKVSVPIEPRLRLTLSAPGAPTLPAGLPGDRVGSAGISWVTAEADAAPVVGPRPVVATATPGPRPGALVLDPAGAAVLRTPSGLAGPIAVVLPPPPTAAKKSEK